MPSFGPSNERFEIEETIGEGAQARVMKCTRLSTGMRYAVKKVNVKELELLGQKRARVNLKREIDIMRELTHVRIVNLLEAFWEGSTCWIVMDYAAGGDLLKLLEPDIGLGSETSSKHVALQILHGMGYMHSHHVIHRDLKPQNILITETLSKEVKGEVCKFHTIKIADFGLSKVMNDAAGSAKGMTKCGTPTLTAPEVARGDYDTRADYWSFGCVIFMMLCGAYPFDTENVPDHIKRPHKYTTGPAPIMSCAAWPTVSEKAKHLVRGLLTCDVNSRFLFRDCLSHSWMNLPGEVMRLLMSDTNIMPDRQVTPVEVRESRRAKPAGLGECMSCLASICRGNRGEEARHRRPIRRVTSLRPKPPPVGVIKEIAGWMGSAVDTLQLTLIDDSQDHHGGGTGGFRQKHWSLAADEVVLAVRQERRKDGEQYLGAALIFYTSLRAIQIKGRDAQRRNAFVAAPGTQIVGLQYDDDEYSITGIRMEPVPQKGPCAVRRVVGRVGYAVDRITLFLRDMSVLAYGGQGGDEEVSFDLDGDEYICFLEHARRDGYVGSSIVFYTSKGNIHVIRGMGGSQNIRFMVPPGRQICRLEFGDDHLLSRVQTCPESGDIGQTSWHDFECCSP